MKLRDGSSKQLYFADETDAAVLDPNSVSLPPSDHDRRRLIVSRNAS
ncbi:MAG: hypothetical protein ACPIOQ_31755 [Promethearchaeia archaeon]